MRLVQRIYANAQSHFHVGDGYSEEFEVKVGVHQGSVLSPLLFIIVIVLQPCHESSALRSPGRKEAMEEKGLRVNAGKMKIMICSTGQDILQSSGEFPCAISRTGMGSNSIFCNGCKYWVHKKCSGLKGLTKDPGTLITDVHGARQLHVPWTADHRGKSVGHDKLEMVASFCYLRDMLTAAGGCDLSTTTRVKTA